MLWGAYIYMYLDIIRVSFESLGFQGFKYKLENIFEKIPTISFSSPSDWFWIDLPNNIPLFRFWNWWGEEVQIHKFVVFSQNVKMERHKGGEEEE